MGLFQTSVLKKHIKLQDTKVIDRAFRKYINYFHNTDIQQNIRESKEEQFQEGFLRELFVNVLDYTLNPKPDFNLTTELKNEKGAKKADGAILKDGKALAVIELKSTKTKDLESIRQQAFDYKANQSACVYVITSNFEKLRFYINNAVEFEEFNLFTLNKEQFELLYLCLHKENVLQNIPLKIKKDSIVAEENITKTFYSDYSLFKRELFRDLVKQNINNEVFRTELQKEDKDRATKNIKLSLFKKSQKLIDRFLFIFFAEDKGLLPPNSALQILDKWKADMDFGDEKPLFDLFKQYFNFLDIGRQGTQSRGEIFAYNGGLFKPDPILNSLVLDSHTLYKHTKILSDYDFESQVGVNILGHIFENSLNEIESVNAEIEGTDFDKQKTKRKKDGVFYTPKYITKYIVDNTVGKLCQHKKAELEIKEEEYHKSRKGRKKETLINLKNKLDNYRNWLLKLTILDPACGSGAFLNQALDFLIKEHTYIDELETSLLGGSIVMQNIENTILENNIYGVDLNEESVEIAKLSLWLRTAQPRRKLNTLNNNIKCGNSIIDSKAVAGNKAFNWQNEFIHIFKDGGFDVVIGNPPYVRQELLGEFKPFFENEYSVYEGTSDLFAYFYEKSFKLLKQKGKFGFISNTFDKTKASVKLRDFLTQNTTFKNYIDFTEVQIFEGATTYPVIIIADNYINTNGDFEYIKIPKASQSSVIDIDLEKSVLVAQNSLDKESWNFNSLKKSQLLSKINKHKSIREQYGKCFRGVVTGFNDAFIIDEIVKTELEEQHESSKELIKPFYEGKDILKWNSQRIKKYIIFTRRGTEIDNFPAIKLYLEQFKERLTPKSSPDIKVGRKAGAYKWFEIQDSVDYYKLFEEPKITWANLQSGNKFSFDNDKYYINAPSVILPSNNKALLCIVNSKLIWEFLKSICVVRSGGYIEVKPQYFEQIPIPKIDNKEALEAKADSVITLTSKLQETSYYFVRYLTTVLKESNISKKLQNWHELEFANFIKELNKAYKKEGHDKMTKNIEMDWLMLFDDYKAKTQIIKTKIKNLEKEINQMVYELYNLTEEEINIVETSVS